MTRGLSTENAAATAAAVVRPVYLARLAYQSGDILVTSAPFSIFFDWDNDGNDEEFLGIGGWGGMSAIQEGASIQMYSITLELSGVSDENLALAMNERANGRDCRIWKGYLDEGHVLVADPYVAFRGRMDAPVIDMQAHKISQPVNSRLTDWFRPRIRRHTNEDQQNEYPGDKGFEFVSQMIEKQIRWGQ